MKKGSFGAVCEHEKNLWQREHLVCYFCLQSTDQGRLGDIWGKKNFFYWSWGNSGQLTQRQLFQRSTKDQRFNDLSFTLEKPCFYSYLWEYGSKFLFLSGTQIIEFTWGRLVGQPASWEVCQREGTFLNIIANEPTSFQLPKTNLRPQTKETAWYCGERWEEQRTWSR